jgi:hypothetical protein
MPRTQAIDQSEQKVLDNIQKFGWHCINVLGDEANEPFSYTIGLFQTYGHPELLIYGLPADLAHAILNIAADAAAKAKPFNLNEPTDEFIEGYSCVFVPVPLAEYPEHVGFAIWFYEGDKFPVQQIVWPFKSGYFPWHADVTDALRLMQPVLGMPERGV